MKRALLVGGFVILGVTFGYMSGCNGDDCNPAVSCVPLEPVDAGADAADAAHDARHADRAEPHG